MEKFNSDVAPTTFASSVSHCRTIFCSITATVRMIKCGVARLLPEAEARGVVVVWNRVSEYQGSSPVVVRETRSSKLIKLMIDTK